MEKLHTLREISNIFSSVVSNTERKISDYQQNKIKELFSKLELNDPFIKELRQRVPDESQFNAVKELLKESGKIDDSCDYSEIISLLKLKNEPNPALTWVKSQIEEVNKDIENSQKLLYPDQSEISLIKSELNDIKSIKDGLMNKLYLAWVKEVLTLPKYNGKISSFRGDLSDEITRKAKEIFGDRWDHSKEKIYLNQLRHHINGNEFNQQWDNELLSSMAAVLLKGDEWEALLYFMQDKGMYDYRIAFSLYGVLNGFANMTRDFTDLLINLEKDNEYVGKIYREFYGQLLGKDIPEVSDPIPEDKNNPEKLCTEPNDSWKDWVNKEIDDNIKRQGQKKVDVKTMLRQSDNIDEFKDKVYKCKDFRKKDGTLRKGFAKLLEGLDTDKIRNKSEQNLFSNNADYRTDFLSGDWIEDCSDMIGDKDAKSKFVEDAEWFLDNYNNEDGQYYKNPKDNFSVINHFKNYNRSRKEKCGRKEYMKIPVKDIIDKIKKRYGV